MEEDPTTIFLLSNYANTHRSNSRVGSVSKRVTGEPHLFQFQRLSPIEVGSNASQSHRFLFFELSDVFGGLVGDSLKIVIDAEKKRSPYELSDVEDSAGMLPIVSEDVPHNIHFLSLSSRCCS